MYNISVSDSDVHTIEAARDEAVKAVAGEIESPVVLSWQDDRCGTFAPGIPGADPQARWREYGQSLGGTHEVDVAHRFRFVIGNAAGFTEPGVHFINLTDSSGRECLCIDASGDPDRLRPLDEAYPAGGGRGDG